MSGTPRAIDACHLCGWLPSPSAISLCKDHGRGPLGFTIRADWDPNLAWVKYGPLVAMSTQDAIADIVNSAPKTAVHVPRVYLAFRHDGRGYIVMEYIDGRDCGLGDASAVAPAVEQLLAICDPTRQPGPVGGGFVTHPFFAGYRSVVPYSTVKDLQAHILSQKEYNCSVDFEGEVREGLSLCLGDINPGNFRIDLSGRVVALDFGATCFLPPSFQYHAMAEGDDFAWEVR